jgi:NifU-like protein involved in Fe-S cluster formation
MDHRRGFMSQRLVLARRRAGLSRFAGRRPIFNPSLELGMLDEIYNRRILELAADIPRLGRLERPMATATAHSRLCGSKVTVDVTMADGVVTEFAHEVKACALGQASSSIMARHVLGSTPDELRRVREEVRRMLKENGAPPAGKWADAAVLEPVRDFKARHASTLLTFDAVVDAVGQIEARADVA